MLQTLSRVPLEIRNTRTLILLRSGYSKLISKHSCLMCEGGTLLSVSTLLSREFKKLSNALGGGGELPQPLVPFIIAYPCFKCLLKIMAWKLLNGAAKTTVYITSVSSVTFPLHTSYSSAMLIKIEQPHPISHSFSEHLSAFLYPFSVSVLHARAKYTVNRNGSKLWPFKGVDTLGVLTNFPGKWRVPALPPCG